MEKFNNIVDHHATSLMGLSWFRRRRLGEPLFPAILEHRLPNAYRRARVEVEVDVPVHRPSLIAGPQSKVQIVVLVELSELGEVLLPEEDVGPRRDGQPVGDLVGDLGIDHAVLVRRAVKTDEGKLHGLVAEELGQAQEEKVTIFLLFRRSGGEGSLIGPVLQHLLHIILGADGKIGPDLPLVAQEVPQGRIFDQGIRSRPILPGIVITEFETRDALEKGRTQTGAVNRQPRVGERSVGRIHARRLLEEAAKSVEGAFVTPEDPGEPQGEFGILRGGGGLPHGQALAGGPNPAGERVEEGEPLPFRELARREMRNGDEIQGEGAWIHAELYRVAPEFQVFKAPPDEKGDEVLGEQVVDEDQVARPPGENLPPGADIEDLHGRKVKVEFPKVRIPPFLHGVPDQIRLEENPALDRTLPGKFHLEPSFPQGGILGLGGAVRKPSPRSAFQETVQREGKSRRAKTQKQGRRKSKSRRISHLARSLGGFLQDLSEKRPSARPRLYFTSP